MRGYDWRRQAVGVMVKNKIRHLLFSVQRSMLIPDEYTSSFILNYICTCLAGHLRRRNHGLES